MDFGAAAAASQQNGGLSFFDGGATAAEISSALQAMPRIGAAAAADDDTKAAAPNADKKGKSRAAETAGNLAAPATAAAAAAAAAESAPPALAPVGQQAQRFVDFSSQPLELGSDSCSSSSGSSSSGSGSSMLALAQKSTRTAKNGREQQRAQKISDVIDQLKVTLDKANFSEGSSSKLHVLVSCESYLRSLKDKIQCYEMETKLREAARGHGQQRPDSDINTISTSTPAAAAAAAASSRLSNSVENWAANNSTAAGREERPASTTPSATGSSRSGGTDRMDTGDESCGGGSGSRGSTRDRPIRSSKKQGLYSASSSSSDDDNCVGGGGGGGVLGISGVAPRSGSTSSSSAADNASSTGSDGDAGSSDSGGGSTSAGTTDSASQGFTTDTTSRGFTTDSSFSGYTGSLGSGDTGSADGASDESEEGTSGSRMRVVNYFDIFRLSNVPMAIANKSGALVDVNDAMRGFGRINQDTVKTLTVGSLVAPESAKALQDAMSKMLAVSTVAQDDPLSPLPAGAQPFLANAGIGNRPTLLTVSLVYDEGGEASAFHVALIPRSTGGRCGVGRGAGGAGGQASVAARNSTEYDAGAPGFSVGKGSSGSIGSGGVVVGSNSSSSSISQEEGNGRTGVPMKEEESAGRSGKRGPGSTWEGGGQNKSQKLRAADA